MATKRKKTHPARAQVIRKTPASSEKQQHPTSAKTTRRHSGRHALVKSVNCEDDHKKQQAVSGNSKKSPARLLVNPAATQVDKHAASLKDKTKDAYEFSETDEFITSHQSKSKSNSKTSKKTATSAKSATKISTLKKTAKSGKKVFVNVASGGERKQTSTPVGSQVQKGKPAHLGPILGKRRSPRAPPALLDISVTPILPVPASLYPKRRRHNDYDPQNDSYVASLLPKTSAPTDCGKPKRQAPRSKRRQPAQIPVNTPTTIASSAKLKRNRPDVPTQSLDYDDCDSGKYSAPVPTQKAKIISEQESPIKKTKFQKNHAVSQSKPPKQKTEKLTKQTGSKMSSASKKTTTAKSTKIPLKKIPASLSDDELKDLWGPENEEFYCLSASKDSGISFGSDASRSASSAEVGSVPGFMEDDVLLGAPPDMSFSPPPSASSTHNSKDPESGLNKSTTKFYKANGKIKKGKGRLSVSRMDAWASEVNQVMEDAESFELVIEG